MTVLFVINDAPYATERPYNAFRLATALQNTGADIRLFLIGDGVGCAATGHTPPADCAYNLEWLFTRLSAGAHETLVCRTCMDARGLTDARLLPGARRGSLDDLTRWTLESDCVLVF